jgi:hypothetical protein
MSQLRENVVVANLMAKYDLKRRERHPRIEQRVNEHQQYYILVECQEVSVLPMPYCMSQIVFSTAFMDEIMEQQSQTHPIILKWKQLGNSMAIAGRIHRP